MSSQIVFYVCILCFVVCLIDNCVGNSASINSRCEGRYKGCCEGFKHDATLNRCIECEVGYYRENCSSRCPKGTYGIDCQEKCSCSEDECHFERGCFNEEQEPPREDKLENILRKTMPGLVFLLIFVMIAYMLVFVFQKLTVRRVIPSIDVVIKEDDSRGKVDNELE
uniref:N-acetylglucosamine-1-phosphodiester alpha-N-acetylglucosaminidase-like n=1 Tax=Crassostrea virginica TaxID=6565 RepID=A0A8B8A5X3_CRAVI|nr:N-acetylglucosamine-1-phosphodiester alpha-N-acetylglucosaminidase-like [Crassostrea virginica]